MTSGHQSELEEGSDNATRALPPRKSVLAALLPGKQVITCRHCGSMDVRPSHKATSSSQYVVYRCRNCKHHFKVVSERPRIHAILSLGLFLLVAGGVIASFFMDTSSEVESRLQPNTQDHQSLSQTQAQAKKGDPQAQYDLGRTYWYRDEFIQALPWLKAAAGQGHTEAEYLLGMAYLKGLGTVQNYRTALEHFTRAAEKNHMESEFQLGIFYRDGLATPRNRETAYLWLNIAAAHGHTEALALRERLTMVMSSEEISRAQEASTEAMKKLHTGEKVPSLSPKGL